MRFIKENTVRTAPDLLNSILEYKMNTVEYNNNIGVITEIAAIVDSVTASATGHILFSVTRNKEIDIVLITISTGTYSKSYNIYKWKEYETIEKPLQIKIHEKVSTTILEDELENLNKIKTCYLSNQEILSFCLTSTLTGYNINIKRFDQLLEYINTDKKQIKVAKKLSDLGKIFKGTVDREISLLRKKYQTFCQKNGAQEIRLTIKPNKIKTKVIQISKITSILELGDYRHVLAAQYIYTGEPKLSLKNTRSTYKRIDIMDNDFSEKMTREHDMIHGYYDTYSSNIASLDPLDNLPYNYADVGRYIILFAIGSRVYQFITEDPRVNKDAIDNIDKSLEKITKTLVLVHGKIDGSIRVKHRSFNLIHYINTIKLNNANIKLNVLYNKAFKTMIDEYKYIAKKKKTIGRDILITDKIKYNHAEGKVSYDDFSIAIQNELIKSKLYSLFNEYLVSYYRGEITEETILNNILNSIFNNLNEVILSPMTGIHTIPITINNTIHIQLDKRPLIYINNIRFNKNEAAVILKEMTCYRDQREADMFINNIGKVGLSTYIGMTTGYQTKLENGQERIFKFKKNKKRSSYTLILDQTELDIKGKELITLLYKRFNNEHVPNFDNKLENAIFVGTGSCLNYLKYKFLIDESYEAFKRKSDEFLSKKVADVDGCFTNYFNGKNQELLKAVSLVGLSGNRYVIAYNNITSYVFMNPELMEEEEKTKIGKDDLEIYKEGKYICMIDQSNIKSNIGYDTVIAKLMALKNDSIIAGTIYNLDEQLQGETE